MKSIRARTNVSLIMAAVLLVAGVACTSDNSTETTTSQEKQADRRAPVAAEAARVPNGEVWDETDCEIFASDNVWHSDVTGLAAEPLDHLPREQVRGVRADPFDPLVLHSGFPPLTPDGEVKASGKVINWVDSTDRTEAIRITGDTWFRESEYTDWVPGGQQANAGVIEHPVPAEGVAMQLNSTDDHALFVDTDTCTAYEHIGWDRSGEARSTIVSVFDLRSNHRRLSSATDWSRPPSNSPEGVINSTTGAMDPAPPGLQRFDPAGARGSVGATSGSGLSSVAALVRVDEVFASPVPGDRTLAADARIDHAIGAVLPNWWIRGIPQTAATALESPPPFVWPATRSDGCAGPDTIDCGMGNAEPGDAPLPMGTRLRLGQEQCDRDWDNEQSAVFVEAMCTHGLIVIDSSEHFSLSVESSNKWDPDATDELAELHLSDFEVLEVDAERGDQLWDAAVTWASETLGSESSWGGGWYEGTFWGALLKSGGPTLDALNSSDWLTATS